MDLFDVNIYVYAYREDTPRHETSLERLESLMNSGDRFAYVPLALSGFLRIVTHPKIFKSPGSFENAMDFLRLITEHPSAVPVNPGSAHWSIFSHLCYRYEPKGNLIPGAWFAALAIDSGCKWVSSDRDFSRFTELRLDLI